MTTALLLLRHGESTWNAERRWQGRADAPLSELGEAQARAAARQLAEHGPFDAVVTSTLQRARRTGQLIADDASIVLGDAIVDLQERSAGRWEGMTRVEIEAEYPGYLDAGTRPDGYEPDDAVVERALAALVELVDANPDRRLVVVSHGGVIHALERHVFGPTHEWLRLDNLEGRWFEVIDGNLAVVGERISLVGDAAAPTDLVGYA
jgi:probable phosphoglycerate mutase